MSLTALGCVGICLALLIVRRRDSLLVLYAIAAVASRFWTYHRNYSNLIIAFLTLALWQAAVASGRRLAWGLFLLVAASLWIPAKAAEHPLAARPSRTWRGSWVSSGSSACAGHRPARRRPEASAPARMAGRSRRRVAEARAAPIATLAERARSC